MNPNSVTPNPRYTFQRNSLYYFRYTLPFDISKVVGKQGLRYSLRTGYIREAERKARKLAGTVETFISEIRHESHKTMNLSAQQLQDILKQYLLKVLEDDEDKRIENEYLTPDDIDEELEAIDYLKSDVREELACADYDGIQTYADTLLKEHEITPDKDSKIYKKLCREILKVHQRVLNIAEKRTIGDYSDEVISVPLSNPLDHRQPQKDEPKLSQVIPKFVSEFIKAGRWTEKTTAENEAVFELFKEIAGDLSINKYDHQAIRNYKETLGKLPANRNKIKKYRDKTIDQIISMPDVKPMAVNSINKNIRRLGQLFKWAVQNGYIERNIVEGMSLPV